MLRPAPAPDPRRFGRRAQLFNLTPAVATAPVLQVSEELRLFATTFVAGFLAVSLYLA